MIYDADDDNDYDNDDKCGMRMRRESWECFPATVGWRSRHASWHVRDARAVMHAGIAN